MKPGDNDQADSRLSTPVPRVFWSIYELGTSRAACGLLLMILASALWFGAPWFASLLFHPTGVDMMEDLLVLVVFWMARGGGSIIPAIAGLWIFVSGIAE